MNPQMRNHKYVMTYLIKKKENAMIPRCTHLHLLLQSHALGDFMGFSAAVNQNHNGNQGCAVVFTQVTQTSPVELGSQQLL